MTESEDSHISGTPEGGRQAYLTNIARDPNFYRNIGMRGGMKGRTGGFYANRELAKIAGVKGGQTSRRKPNKDRQDRFIKIWNSSLSTAEVAEQMDMRQGSCSSWATQLRKRGHTMKYMSRWG